MNRTNIYLERRQTKALDRLAAEEGVSRAEIIRRLLDQALAASDRNLESDLVAINATFGVLRDAEPPVRAAGEREAHLAKIWREP